MKKELVGAEHRLGILGGGQLGRMLIQEAISYNIHVHVMESTKEAPSSSLANSYTVGDIKDYKDVLAFGSDKDVITVEIENVNVDALKELEKQGVLVYPQPSILEIIKDKGLQKQFYIDHQIPTSKFELTTSETSRDHYLGKLPFVHKLRTGGYDGNGVQLVRSEADLDRVFNADSILEEMIPFSKELSVIVARNSSGQTAVYQTVECEFNDANLVAFLFSPAQIDSDTEQRATELAISVINAFEMVGLLAVELFLLPNGELMVNEVAPRPHNSGHHTIECNVTSQFEQHLRAVLDLPLGSTELIRKGAMINLLGAEGYDGPARYEGLNDILGYSGVHVHLYGKAATRANRKMGHITVTHAKLEDAKDLAQKILSEIRVIS
ncbi:MAG: 5-(carboxyamino)imidazole ribonucleotide synthase [Crocinitomicaceae bacterium]|jgi:5-(carboxyamino)imidazole ribonucleotide synthase